MDETFSKDRGRVGALLIWLGVLAWLPYFVFLANGREISVLPFLAAHLVGVIGGARLRSTSKHSANSVTEQSPSLQRRLWASRFLIYLGVLAWAPYIYLTRIAGQDVEVAPFLAVHLLGVLSGAALRASVQFMK